MRIYIILSYNATQGWLEKVMEELDEGSKYASCVAHVQKRVPNEVTRFLLSYDYIKVFLSNRVRYCPILHVAR